MKISIITSTFNSEKYLEENLKALYKQDYKNYILFMIIVRQIERTKFLKNLKIIELNCL